jgi:hypothetical protein
MYLNVKEIKAGMLITCVFDGFLHCVDIVDSAQYMRIEKIRSETPMFVLAIVGTSGISEAYVMTDQHVGALLSVNDSRIFKECK